MEEVILLDMIEINGKYTVKNVPHIVQPGLTIEGEPHYRLGSVDYRLAQLIEYMEENNIDELDYNDVDKYLRNSY